MKTFRILVSLTAALLLGIADEACADGLLRSTHSQYPGDFLRLRSTRVDVKILGDVALTTVEQEFVNEWHLPTDAVYAFPLPADARATDFLFWSNDTLFRAVLKELEQAPNPGTGEGGIAALLTKYLGANALRVRINGIPARGTQRIEMHYISLCRYHQGKFDYRYPLNTDAFVTYPAETVSFALHVTAPGSVLSASVPGWSDVKIRMVDSAQVEVAVERSKFYPTVDFGFSYSVATDSLGLSFFSAANDSLDGHFGLILRPRSDPDTTMTLAKHVVFVLDRSSSTAGPMLDGSIAATRECLRRLHGQDRFNIIVFDYSPTAWQPNGAVVTPENIAAAEVFLDGITASGGSDLGQALGMALASLSTDTLLHSILLFSDGRSSVDPRQIRSQNSSKAGIFPIGIGSDIARERLAMLAYENYGFPTYLALDEPLTEEIVRVFTQVNYPVLVDTRFEMGSNAYDLLPSVPHAVYEGSRLMIAGRYRNPVASTLSIAGMSLLGTVFYDFRLQFSSDTRTYRFAESLWAKERIDQLEREIALYGATDSLKRLLVSISLRYNIRCKYTAYVAEKDDGGGSTGIDDSPAMFVSATAVMGTEGVIIEWVPGDVGDVSEIHVYRAESAGGAFVKIGTVGAHDKRFVDVLPLKAGTRYRLEAVTPDGRRYWSDTFVPGKSGVHVLYQNFPSPCNPSTTIRYFIPGSTTAGKELVLLSVYDLLGREVKTLVHGEQQSGGTHEVVWDGRDDRGREISSGVYIYRLVVGSFSAARSTLVIR